MKVVVVGAGVIGMTTAYELLKSGHEVTVVDRASGPAQGTSHANGGFLSPSSCGPWAAPGVPTMALKTLFDPSAPMRLRPDGTLRQIRWLLAMARECTASRFAVNNRRMKALGYYSLTCLNEVERDTGLAFARRNAGMLLVCRRPQEQAEVMRGAEKLRAMGKSCEWLNPAQLAEAEPGLATSSPGWLGALRIDDEGSGCCETFSRGMAGWLAQRGVRFMWNAAVEDVVLAPAGAGQRQRFARLRVGGQDLDADACVVATGSDTARLLASHMDVPVYPVKGYSMTAPVIDGSRLPRHAVLDPVSKLAIATLGGVVRVAGFAEVCGHDLRMEPARCEQLASSFAALYPGAADVKSARFWTGLRPMTPDGTPIIGATGVQGLYLNTGHGTFGWTLSCGSARMLANLIDGRDTALPAGDYALGRYSSTH